RRLPLRGARREARRDAPRGPRAEARRALTRGEAARGERGPLRADARRCREGRRDGAGECEPRRGARPRTRAADRLRAWRRAARDLEGPPGARAAWLLADFLVASGRDAEAREAVAEAAKRDARPEDRASLERVLAAPKDARGYAALAARLHEAGALVRAAFEL